MGDNQMIYNRILKLLSYYLCKENTKEELLEFRNQFEELYDTYRDELYDEIGQYKYELLDDIYMIFDSYEEEEAIREYDQNCIDEVTLLSRIKIVFEKLTQHDI